MFMQPKGPNGNYFFGPDEYKDSEPTNSSRTITELAFQEWDRLCGIPIGGKQNSDCEIDADLPLVTVEEEPGTGSAAAIVAYWKFLSFTSLLGVLLSGW